MDILTTKQAPPDDDAAIFFKKQTTMTKFPDPGAPPYDTVYRRLPTHDIHSAHEVQNTASHLRVSRILL